MILVDTNLLLDVVGADPVWGEWSRSHLNAAAATDDIAINAVVYAELSAGYSRIEQLDEMLTIAGLALASIPCPALFLAGQGFPQIPASGREKNGRPLRFLYRRARGSSRCDFDYPRSATLPQLFPRYHVDRPKLTLARARGEVLRA